MTVVNRKALSNRIILTCLLEQKQNQGLSDTEENLKTHLALSDHTNPESHTLEISSKSYRIRCASEEAMLFYNTFNQLSQINDFVVTPQKEKIIIKDENWLFKKLKKMEFTDMDQDGNAGLDREEIHELFDKEVNDPKIIDVIFDAIDYDGDGDITPQEWTRWQKGFKKKDLLQLFPKDPVTAPEAVLLLKYEKLPFKVGFSTPRENLLIRSMSTLEEGLDKGTSGCGCSEECRAATVGWASGFIAMSLGLWNEIAGLTDVITDLILLYKAAQSGAITFTMIFFITYLAPYILSYSSGVQIFLYRKTFLNVQAFSFQSLMLGLYLFPTGILYFILMDVINALMEAYKWFTFGVANKDDDEVVIESTVAEYFGMGRMDYISFQNQKSIAQLLLSADLSLFFILFSFAPFTVYFL